MTPLTFGCAIFMYFLCPQEIRKINSLALWETMFCIYIEEAAAKQELNRSRSLKFSLQQEQELEPESILQEQDWIRS